MPKTEEVTTLGGRLRAARDATKLSTAALARELRERGVQESSTATINRIENGEKVPDLEYVTALSEISGYSLDWLVHGRGSRGTAKDVIERLRKELDAAESEYVVAGATRSASGGPPGGPEGGGGGPGEEKTA